MPIHSLEIHHIYLVLTDCLNEPTTKFRRYLPNFFLYVLNFLVPLIAPSFLKTASPQCCPRSKTKQFHKVLPIYTYSVFSPKYPNFFLNSIFRGKKPGEKRERKPKDYSYPLHTQPPPSKSVDSIKKQKVSDNITETHLYPKETY